MRGGNYSPTTTELPDKDEETISTSENFITDDMKTILLNIANGLNRGLLRTNNKNDKAIYESRVARLLSDGEIEPPQAEYMQEQIDELFK